jgi:hypothetical protein
MTKRLVSQSTQSRCKDAQNYSGTGTGTDADAGAGAGAHTVTSLVELKKSWTLDVIEKGTCRVLRNIPSIVCSAGVWKLN